MAYMRGDWDLALRLADHSAEDPPPTPRAMLEAVALLGGRRSRRVAALAGCRPYASGGTGRE